MDPTRVRVVSTGLLFSALAGLAGTAEAQWTHRYPKVEGYSHHVYLEGYELPYLNAGPSDPAPSPDGKSLAVSARGWIWLIDLDSKQARRLTRRAEMDFRPRWSPDSRAIVFLRDDTRNTTIVEVDLPTGAERVLVEEPAILLDPIFSLDGRAILYSSAQAGDLDLWRMDRSTGAKTRLTESEGLELCPLPVSEREIVFVSKAQSGDTVSILDTSTGESRVLIEESIGSQMRPSLDPNGKSLVVPLPDPDQWALWLTDLEGGPRIRVTTGEAGLPVMPAFSADGRSIFFVEADEAQRFHVKSVSRGGGEIQEVGPLAWEWGEPVARFEIRTHRKGSPGPFAARLHVTDEAGHPALPESGQPRFDSQSGKVYLYSPGVLTVEAPAGTLRVEATHGLSTPVTRTSVTASGGSASVDLELEPLWSGGAGGWYSGDHHFHLNYGGPYPLQPESLVTILRAEDLDVATPLMANLHTRLTDLGFRHWTRLGSGAPLIAFGQEVRPHFLGHMGLIGISSPHWPWFWGPGYPIYGDDDRPNGSALEHARREGGVNSFVHPVMAPEPFPEDGTPRGLPIELVPEALHGEVDTLEIACLWSDESGTADAWYRLLNVGLAIAPSAGTDAFSNFYRSMTVGAARVYVRLEGPLNLESYLDGLRRGRSFVTTGPHLDFEIGGAGPGEVVPSTSGRDVPFSLTLMAAAPVDKVEVLVNGETIWEDGGLSRPGKRVYSGRLSIPAGGWIAARATGGASVWPEMDSYPFVHTAPVWIGRVGSVDGTAAERSARELLAWMAVAEARLVDGYGSAKIPVLRERFEEARRELESIAR